MPNVLNLTTGRKTVDHVVSGAVFAAITAGGLSYANSRKENAKDVTKDTLKLVLQGGIASGSAISCANSIATRNYAAAAISFAVGFGAVVAIEKIMKTKKGVMS